MNDYFTYKELIVIFLLLIVVLVTIVYYFSQIGAVMKRAKENGKLVDRLMQLTTDEALLLDEYTFASPARQIEIDTLLGCIDAEWDEILGQLGIKKGDADETQRREESKKTKRHHTDVVG